MNFGWIDAIKNPKSFMKEIFYDGQTLNLPKFLFHTKISTRCPLQPGTNFIMQVLWQFLKQQMFVIGTTSK